MLPFSSFSKNLTIITASERQCQRWAKLGLLENQIHTSGNLKIDAVSREYFGPKNRVELVEEFGFDQESMILAGISTWKGEEKLLVEIVQTLRLENLDIRLLIIPRHAERRKKLFIPSALASCLFMLEVRKTNR